MVVSRRTRRGSRSERDPPYQSSLILSTFTGKQIHRGGGSIYASALSSRRLKNFGSSRCKKLVVISTFHLLLLLRYRVTIRLRAKPRKGDICYEGSSVVRGSGLLDCNCPDLVRNTLFNASNALLPGVQVIGHRWWGVS